MIQIGEETFRTPLEQLDYLTNYLQSATPIKVDGQVDSFYVLPDPTQNAGKTFAAGTQSPYYYYASDGERWISLGQFPKAGPAGPQGPAGEIEAGFGLNETGNTLEVDTDEIATVQYVDQSVTGLATMSEVNDAIDDRVPAPTTQDVGKFLYAITTGNTTWFSPNYETKGYTTVRGTTYTNETHKVTIVTNGVTTTFTLFGT